MNKVTLSLSCLATFLKKMEVCGSVLLSAHNVREKRKKNNFTRNVRREKKLKGREEVVSIIRGRIIVKIFVKRGFRLCGTKVRWVELC